MGLVRLFFGNPSSEVTHNKGDNCNFIEEINKTLVPITKISSEDTIYTSELSDTGKKQLLYQLKRLAVIDGFSDYHDWIKLGTGLKFGGFTLGDWKSLSNEDVLDHDFNSKWKSFREKVSIGTLVYFIRENLSDQRLFFPQLKNTFTIPKEELKKYNIVDKFEFVSIMNSKYIKTINNRGPIIYNISDGEKFNIKAIEELYKEYMYNIEGDTYGKAYDWWDRNTVMVKKIKKSSDKDGFIIIDGEKTRNIIDESIRNNLIYKINGNNIMNSFNERINNNHGYVPSSYLGINACLDRGYKNGYPYLINAATGTFKTFFLLNEAMGIAAIGKKVFIISTEMNWDQISQRMVAIHYGSRDDKINLLKFRADPNGDDIFKNIGFLHADRSYTTDIVLELVKKDDFDIVVIDYLDEFTPTVPTEIEYKKHKVVSEDFTELARTLDVPVLTATQSNRKGLSEDGSVPIDRGYSNMGDSYQKTHKMAAVWNVCANAKNSAVREIGFIPIKNRDIPNPPDVYFSPGPSGKMVEIKPPIVFPPVIKIKRNNNTI
jgi:KaiC/GvpD/RAD55 family RecA-like ATPase